MLPLALDFDKYGGQCGIQPTAVPFLFRPFVQLLLLDLVKFLYLVCNGKTPVPDRFNKRPPLPIRQTKKKHNFVYVNGGSPGPTLHRQEQCCCAHRRGDKPIKHLEKRRKVSQNKADPAHRSPKLGNDVVHGEHPESSDIDHVREHVLVLAHRAWKQCEVIYIQYIYMYVSIYVMYIMVKWWNIAKRLKSRKHLDSV